MIVQRFIPRHGFTLIEMLVVVSLIALLIAIMMPVLASARESARIAQCGSNIRQTGMGTTNYAIDRQGHLPQHNDGGWRVPNNYTLRYFNAPGDGGLHSMGRVWLGDYFTSGEFLYCPSQMEEVFTYRYYTQTGPFPIGAPGGGGFSSGFIRMSATHNPMFDANRRKVYRHVQDLSYNMIYNCELLDTHPWGRLHTPHQTREGFTVGRGDHSVQFELAPDVFDAMRSDYGGWHAGNANLFREGIFRLTHGRWPEPGEL